MPSLCLHKYPLKCWTLIVLAGTLCYLNALGNDFVFDDSAYIGSPLIRQFLPLATFCESWIHPDLYRPLTLLSLAFDFLCYGDQPLGYHLSNLLLHLLNALLVFHLSLRFLAQESAALLASLFYTLHPVQTEVVCWISSRGDLLMSFFFLTGLLCHFRAKMQRWRIMAWILCGFGALAKESGFVLPVIAWCYDALFPKRNRPLRHLPAFTLTWLGHNWGYVLVLALILALRWNATAAEGPVSTNFLADTDIASRLMTLPAILLRYLSLIFFPLHLSADYSYASIPLVREPLDPYFLAGCLTTCALVYLPLRVHSPLLTFAVAFCWLTFLPTSNLLVLAPSGMAERYLYPTMPALALLVGLAAKTWSHKVTSLHWRNAGRALAILILLLLTTRTVDRNRDWANNYTLFSSVVALYPDNARARENLGHESYQQGHVRTAIGHYKQAIAIYPNRVRTHYNLGLIYNAEGRHHEAIQTFKAAQHLNPHHLGTLYNAGLAHHRLDRFQDAIDYYEKVLRLDPDHSRAAYNLGRAYQLLDQSAEAIHAYQTALDLDPDNASAYYHLGEVYRLTGNFLDMTTSWKTLLRLVPNHPEAERLRQFITAQKKLTK